MPLNYKKTAISGGIWTFGAQAFIIVVQLASITILARLLSPSDFGLIGMLAVVTGFLGLFGDCGLITAIVQRPNVNQEDLSRIFRLTAILGLILCILTIIAGFFTSILVKEPRINLIAPWMGLCYFLTALESVPLGILRRNLQFRGIAIRDLSVRTLSFSAALLSALAGHGYWALVIQSVSASSISLVFTMIAAKYLPTAKPSSWHAVKSYLRFGAEFTVSNGASYLTHNLDSFLVGKYWGIETLGIYSRSRALMVAPMNQIMGPVGSVLMPIFCKISNNNEQTLRWLDRICFISLMTAAPLAAFVIVGAEELVQIFLGVGWDSAIPIFKWLAITIFITPFGTFLYIALIASGKTRLLIQWTWLEAIIACSVVAISAPHGAVATAAAYGLSGLVFRVFIGITITSKAGIISFKNYIKKYSLGIIYAVIWVAYLYGVHQLFIENMTNNYIKILLLALFCFLGFGFLLCVIPRGRHEVLNFIKIIKDLRQQPTS